MFNLTTIFGYSLRTHCLIKIMHRVLAVTKIITHLSDLSKRSYPDNIPQNQLDKKHTNFESSTTFVNIDSQPIDIPVGAHLVSPRKVYLHHGIYLGNGNIAHYSGFSVSLRPGPIEITNIVKFSNGKPVWIFHEHSNFTNDEIANRAQSRVGECEYKILSNNCEHFCNWCIRGNSQSTQVSELFHCPRRFLAFVATLDSCLIA
ncbi:lecithin retinol acyltransferase family protein [Pseudomonas sp. PHC1]|uniref:lecithin retinol acyltransferase family protein n=1 Tax=Pseudomonas sp. PHC1 TaxID=3384759 RepID=UPI00396F675C